MKMIDIETLNALIESIGIGVKLRTFLVDYTDMNGNDYNKPLCTIPLYEISDGEIIAEAKRELQGYTVTAISEILDMQGYKRLRQFLDSHQIDYSETLPQNVISEAKKSIRPLYLNI